MSIYINGKAYNRSPQGRLISYVLDVNDNFNEVDCDVLLKTEKTSFLLRHEIEEGSKSYICPLCKEEVKPRGGLGTGKILHFSHRRNTSCLLSENNNLTKEDIERLKYNGVAESDLHHNIKNTIANLLKKQDGVTDVFVEKTIRDKSISCREYRRPDIQAVYNGRKIVFEIQLSTTFLHVVLARNRFYQRNNISIFWIFHEFSLDANIQKFTQKDAFYSNSQFHAVVFDKHRMEMSKINNNLNFEVNYHRPVLSNKNEIYDEWETRDATLNDFKYHSKTSMPYIFNYEKEYGVLKKIQHQKNEQRIRNQKEREILEIVEFEIRERLEGTYSKRRKLIKNRHRGLEERYNKKRNEITAIQSRIAGAKNELYAEERKFKQELSNRIETDTRGLLHEIGELEIGQRTIESEIIKVEREIENFKNGKIARKDRLNAFYVISKMEESQRLIYLKKLTKSSDKTIKEMAKQRLFWLEKTNKTNKNGQS